MLNHADMSLLTPHDVLVPSSEVRGRSDQTQYIEVDRVIFPHAVMSRTQPLGASHILFLKSCFESSSCFIYCKLNWKQRR